MNRDSVDSRVLYAHSRTGCSPLDWHPLTEHLASTAELARYFAEPFSSGNWAFAAGYLHDFGKNDSIFQGYLRRCNAIDDSDYDSGRINHSSAGAAFAEDLIKPFGRILAYIVAGHHAGLPDWHPSESGNAALSVRLNEGRENLKRIATFTHDIEKRIFPLVRPSFVTAENFHLWMRMLFSCLVDADFLDTERFLDKSTSNERGNHAELVDLAPRLFQYLDKLENTAVESPINTIRAEVRRACESKTDLPKGLFSLTVPTGGGKTLSAMAFAMRHAIKHAQKRIIYVIPYTSIIEQTGGILADVFGRDSIVEHHSNLNPTKETRRSQLSAENWDAPIIITTNVQFFESLYAAKSSRCRKLHNIVNSVIILDEAQLLPPTLLRPCVNALNELVRNYGVTIIMSTATQPSPPQIDPVTEIIPEELNLYERLKRTTINFPASSIDTTNWGLVAERLQKYDQVLCIVNSRRDCYDLFKLMPEGTLHLSALMCGEHRTAIIRLIRRRLRNHLPIRVISTQLVEAGVDIDFPVVFRALAGLDSIAQSAGRCNREGRLNTIGKLGEVHVFIPPKPAPPGILRKGEDTIRELYEINANLERPETFSRYFKLFYSRINDTGSQFHDLLVKDVNPSLYVQFRTAADHFRLIDEEGRRSVIVRYGSGDDLIKIIRFAGPTRNTMRRLQRYLVNIPLRIAEMMLADGRLEEISPGILAQSMLNIYDHLTGLAVYVDQLPIEDLIIN